MASLLESYEQQYSSVTADITYNVGRISSSYGDLQRQAMADDIRLQRLEVERKLWEAQKEAEKLRKEMKEMDGRSGSWDQRNFKEMNNRPLELRESFPGSERNMIHSKQTVRVRKERSKNQKDQELEEREKAERNLDKWIEDIEKYGRRRSVSSESETNDDEEWERQRDSDIHRPRDEWVRDSTEYGRPKNQLRNLGANEIENLDSLRFLGTKRKHTRWDRDITEKMGSHSRNSGRSRSNSRGREIRGEERRGLREEPKREKLTRERELERQRRKSLVRLRSLGRSRNHSRERERSTRDRELKHLGRSRSRSRERERSTRRSEARQIGRVLKSRERELNYNRHERDNREIPKKGRDRTKSNESGRKDWSKDAEELDRCKMDFEDREKIDGEMLRRESEDREKLLSKSMRIEIWKNEQKDLKRWKIDDDVDDLTRQRERNFEDLEKRNILITVNVDSQRIENRYLESRGRERMVREIDREQMEPKKERVVNMKREHTKFERREVWIGTSTVPDKWKTEREETVLDGHRVREGGMTQDAHNSHLLPQELLGRQMVREVGGLNSNMLEIESWKRDHSSDKFRDQNDQERISIQIERKKVKEEEQFERQNRNMFELASWKNDPGLDRLRYIDDHERPTIQMENKWVNGDQNNNNMSAIDRSRYIHDQKRPRIEMEKTRVGEGSRQDDRTSSMLVMESCKNEPGLDRRLRDQNDHKIPRIEMEINNVKEEELIDGLYSNMLKGFPVESWKNEPGLDRRFRYTNDQERPRIDMDKNRLREVGDLNRENSNMLKMESWKNEPYLDRRLHVYPNDQERPRIKTVGNRSREEGKPDRQNSNMLKMASWKIEPGLDGRFRDQNDTERLRIEMVKEEEQLARQNSHVLEMTSWQNESGLDKLRYINAHERPRTEMERHRVREGSRPDGQKINMLEVESWKNEPGQNKRFRDEIDDNRPRIKKDENRLRGWGDYPGEQDEQNSNIAEIDKLSFMHDLKRSRIETEKNKVKEKDRKNSNLLQGFQVENWSKEHGLDRSKYINDQDRPRLEMDRNRARPGGALKGHNSSLLDEFQMKIRKKEPEFDKFKDTNEQDRTRIKIEKNRVGEGNRQNKMIDMENWKREPKVDRFRETSEQERPKIKSEKQQNKWELSKEEHMVTKKEKRKACPFPNCSEMSQYLRGQSGEKQNYVRQADKLFEEANELLEQMELEVNDHEPQSRKKYQTRIKSYKTEMGKLQKDLKRAKLGVDTSRDELLGDDNTHDSEDQRARLLDNSEQLERSTRRLDHSYKVVLETEQMGTDILEDLNSQRQTITRSRQRLEDMNTNLGKSSRVLSGMLKRIIQNRILLLGIILFIIGIIIVAIYFTVTKHT